MRTMRMLMGLMMWIPVLGLGLPLCGQVVQVTLRLDTNEIAVGGSTTLRVLAQVVPGQQANSERILSWYVDVANTNAAAATANYGLMVKAASDRNARTSSTGTNQGPNNRRGIYDTFLNAATKTGVSAPVELMAIPVSGLAAGTTRFVVGAGTGTPQLSADFLVNPVTGPDPLTGGIYTMAFVDLTVRGAGGAGPGVRATISATSLAGGQTRASITFPVLPAYSYYVEYLDLIAGGGWQILPGGPHNSGSVTDLTTSGAKIYRVRTETSLRLRLTASGGQGTLTWGVSSGVNYTVEYHEGLGVGNWQPLPGGPHNSGSLTVNLDRTNRFYRVKAVGQ